MHSEQLSNSHKKPFIARRGKEKETVTDKSIGKAFSIGWHRDRREQAMQGKLQADVP